MIKVSVMYPNTLGARFATGTTEIAYATRESSHGWRFAILYCRQGPRGWSAWNSRDVCRNVPHLLRIDRGIPGWFGPHAKESWLTSKLYRPDPGIQIVKS